MSDQLPEVRTERAVATPMEILAGAVTEGKLDAESLKVIAELAWKDQDRNARKEYNRQLSAFRKACPEIVKTVPGPVLSKDGTNKPAYYYAPIEQIEPAIRPLLTGLGFNYTWDARVDGSMMTVTCVLRHEGGHEERSSFACPTDSRSPGMSEQQKYAGARKLGMRKSLEQVLGLVGIDDPEDGTGRPPPGPIPRVTPEQAAEIETWAKSIGVDEKAMLDWLGATSFEDIPESKLERARAALRKRQGES